MEDLYSLLDCDETATYEELKRSYQKIALRVHPDKVLSQSEGKVSDVKGKTHDEFAKINFAWNILGNPDLRKQYDIKWKQRCVSQDWPIQDDIEIDDFEKCELSETNDVTFIYPCRCGGLYVLLETDIQIKFDIVCCDTCSLSVRILYDSS